MCARNDAWIPGHEKKRSRTAITLALAIVVIFYLLRVKLLQLFLGM
jgi:hypothetical protein